MPGAEAAAKRLVEAGFTLFTVSNQPSAAKGKVPLERLFENEAFIESRFRDAGAPILRGYYCHHHPEGIGGQSLRSFSTKLLKSVARLGELVNAFVWPMVPKHNVGSRSDPVEAVVPRGI